LNIDIIRDNSHLAALPELPLALMLPATWTLFPSSTAANHFHITTIHATTSITVVATVLTFFPEICTEPPLPLLLEASNLPRHRHVAIVSRQDNSLGTVGIGRGAELQPHRKTRKYRHYDLQSHNELPRRPPIAMALFRTRGRTNRNRNLAALGFNQTRIF